MRPNATFRSALAALFDPVGPLRLRLEVTPYPLPPFPATADCPRLDMRPLRPRSLT